MRVLVVGTTPPPGGLAARRFALVAAERLAAGDEITLLSPDPRSAAHRSTTLNGWSLPLWLAFLSRRHDALELRLQPGIPLASAAGRLQRSAVLLALGAACSRFGEVTVRLDHPVPLAGGVGGRATSLLWRSTSRVVVENEQDREMLTHVPELSETPIEVSAPLEAEPAPDGRWPQATDPDLRARALGEIRRLSIAERRIREVARNLGGEAPTRRSAFDAGDRVRPSLAGVAETFAGALYRRARRLVGSLSR
jgi:hypothetical protein